MLAFQNPSPFFDPMNELDLYRANVERLAELESKEVFSNSRAEHAAVIFETFFKKAKQSVVLFCENLSEKVFNLPSVLSFAESALRRGTRLTVLVQKTPQATTFLESVKRWQKDELPITIQVSKPGSEASTASANFAVMDRKAYRFEPNRGEPAAFACMNDVASADRLLGLFSRLERTA